MKRTELITLKLNTIKSWPSKLKNKNITEVAKKAKVSRGTIYNALKGESVPSLSTINRIEEALND